MTQDMLRIRSLNLRLLINRDPQPLQTNKAHIEQIKAVSSRALIVRSKGCSRVMTVHKAHWKGHMQQVRRWRKLQQRSA